MTKNIMIVGVGGQGTLLASKVLGQLFVDHGFDVKVSEVHGMSQRGGSVVTYVRYGDKVYSPLIEKGEADFIVSFELLESARWVEYLNPKTGVLITNMMEIMPMPVITGAAEYPSDILNKLDVKVDSIDAGNERTTNIMMLGRLSRYFDFDVEDWTCAIKACVKPEFVDMNIAAFEQGR